jgi:hypothetical protein
MLEVRNAGPKDAVLNLGIMLANGARQYSTAITLVLTDAEGKGHHAELAEPAGVTSGRLDPFIVPLPSGASLKLPVHISKCLWYASGHIEDFEPDPKKHYTVQAQFTGKGVSQAEANLDVKGIALLRSCPTGQVQWFQIPSRSGQSRAHGPSLTGNVLYTVCICGNTRLSG